MQIGTRKVFSEREKCMAGNENVAANYSEMSATAAQFNAKVAEFEQALAQINSAVQQVGATWIGQGNMSFNAVMAKWHSEVNTLNQTLGEISTNVNRSSTQYSETDSCVAQGFNRFG